MTEDLGNMVPYQLEMEWFNPVDYQDHINKFLDLNYHFFFLAETTDSSQNQRKLYELVAEGVLSSPQSDGRFENYDQFIERLFKPYYWDVGTSQLLAEINNEWVGLTSVIVDPQTGEGNCGLTMVKKTWQNKGLAKALKVVSLTRAKEQGAKLVFTKNHETNLAMIKVNRALGFKQMA